MLVGIFIHGALDTKANQQILSRNHATVNISPNDIESKLQQDLAKNRIVKVSVAHSDSFMSSPLGLVPKHDGSLCRIHDLSYPRRSSVNAHIDPSYGALKYASIEHIIGDIVKAGRHCTILKMDIKDAFRNIPVAPQGSMAIGVQVE